MQLRKSTVERAPVALIQNELNIFAPVRKRVFNSRRRAAENAAKKLVDFFFRGRR
jgi:hypothetical protein